MIKIWIEAVRLRTLPVSIAGVLTAVAFNILDGSVQWFAASLCMLFALLCQTASNFANEYFDYRAGRDNAGREGPRRGVTEGDITPRAMLAATAATLLAAAVIGLVIASYGGWWLIAPGILIALGALAYSAGPYPLSTHCLGEAAVMLFFGVVPVCLTYYVQAHHITAPVLSASLAVGLMGANVLIVNNYRDAVEDLAVGKHTLANTMGRHLMPWLYAANAIIASALWIPAWHRLDDAWIVVPLLYSLAAIAVACRMARLNGRQLNPFLGLTAMSMAIVSLLFFTASLISA